MYVTATAFRKLSMRLLGIVNALWLYDVSDLSSVLLCFKFIVRSKMFLIYRPFYDVSNLSSVLWCFEFIVRSMMFQIYRSFKDVFKLSTVMRCFQFIVRYTMFPIYCPLYDVSNLLSVLRCFRISYYLEFINRWYDRRHLVRDRVILGSLHSQFVDYYLLIYMLSLSLFNI